MKKITVGIIIGFMLAIAVQGFANTIDTFTAQRATFDVYVNGEALDTSSKPAVVIGGSTYLPLVKTSEALGVPVEWNGSARRVEIGDMETTEVMSSTEAVEGAETIATPSPSPEPTMLPTFDPTGLPQNKTSENVDIKIIGARRIPRSEPRNFGVPGHRLVQIDTEITNNSSQVLAITFLDIKVKYKVKDINSSTSVRLKSKYPDGIVKAEIINNRPYSVYNTNGDDLISFQFGNINPGQTIRGTIVYPEVETNADWFCIMYGGAEIYGKHD